MTAVLLLQREKMDKAEAPEAKQCTFRPDIGNAVDVLVQRRAARLTETEEERCVRLSREDTERIDRAKAFISESYYQQFTYQPTINSHSKVRPPSSACCGVGRARADGGGFVSPTCRCARGCVAGVGPIAHRRGPCSRRRRGAIAETDSG